jgi:uncharacterized peroxidase-related enzyme
MPLVVHNTASAPDRSRPTLERTLRTLGFVPNLYGVLAGSPALLRGYTSLSDIFNSTSLNPVERQVVLLAISVENGCEYCVAAHSAIASGQGVPGETITALRDGSPLTHARLEALRAFTCDLVRNRGWMRDEEMRSFLDAGFTDEQVLDVILGIGLKTMSNYLNHIAATPLDPPFSAHAWRRQAQEA